MSDSISFPYKMNILKLLPAILIFGGLSYAMATTARDNNKGLIIDYIIQLNTQQASIFFGVLSAILGAVVALCVVMMIMSLVKKGGMLVLTETELSLPWGVFRVVREIPFYQIDGMRLVQVQSQVFLEISSQGKKTTISRSMLPEGAFEQVYKVLAERTKSSGA